jgi:hypothetical protein
MGILTLALFSLSPFHLAYSQEMRPYALSLTVSLAALWTLEDVIAGKQRRLALLTFLWTAQLYTHYWGTFVVLAQALYGIRAVPSPTERKKIFFACGAAGAMFALWLPILAAQMGMVDRLAFWVPAFSFANLGKVYLAYTGLIFNMASWTFYLPAKVWLLAVLGLVFAWALVLGVRHGSKAALIWLTVGLGIPWLLSLWKPTVFLAYRYPIHMFPAFVLLVASGLTASKVRSPKSNIAQTLDLGRRTLLVVVLLGSQGWGDWVYFHAWQKANPKAVVQYVHRLRGPNTIVIRPSYFADLFNFYDQGTTPVIDEHLLDTPEKRAALKGRDILFVAFDVPSDPILEAFLSERQEVPARYFPGTAHLGITVYQLK